MVDRDAEVRQAAQEGYGAASNHEDVRVLDRPPVPVEGGYWVLAELWVPSEWVDPQK